MVTLTNDLDGWASGDLLAEVLRRSAGDRPALQLLQAMTIRALLADSDRESLASRD